MNAGSLVGSLHVRDGRALLQMVAEEVDMRLEGFRGRISSDAVMGDRWQWEAWGC